MLMYHPYLPLKSQICLCYGVSWIITFVPSGDVGFQLYSNAPFRRASAESLGFIRDLRSSFKVCVACGRRRNHICMGKVGSTPLIPASNSIMSYS